ncbi:TPA: hypothetical protein N0F65_003826 [Lagenidium giganteum]|uniref:ER membrane protein complex subunit 7 beta-sandwich domain-containing protein n=1 Tax=Lagenidium giganteum TaxID=4803 RepID=A0AAV2YT73_9STRA|nr:TPA: hypothetical protein N0F65_003826 [Lagenidium giganteum]
MKTAYDIRGTIYLGEQDKVSPLRVLLNGGEQVTYARADRSFIFRDVAPGRYVVDIPSELYLFSQFKLDVADDGNIRAIEYKYPGATKQRAEYPLTAEVLTEINYFEEREKFNLLQLIMSPSFLTVVLPIAMLYVLPKLSESMMDPEEFKKAQEEIGTQDPAALLQGMFGGGQSKAEDSDDD